MSLSAVRQALADVLADLDEWQVSPYMLSSPAAPCAMIGLGDTVYDEAGSRGLDRVVLTIMVQVQGSLAEASQDQLDAYAQGHGPRSVKAAVYADRTLGGTCVGARVTSCSGTQLYTVGNEQRAGIEFEVEVYVRGDA